MKKLFSLIAAVLFAGSMFAVTLDPGTQEAVTPVNTNAGDPISLTINGIQIDYTGALSAANGTTPADFRVFAGKTMTLTATSNISKVVIAGKANKAGFTASVDNGTITTGDSYSSVTTKATLEDPLIVIENINAASVTLTVGKQLRAYMIEVTLAEGGETPVEPACKWDEIAFLGNGSGVAAYTDRFKVCTGDPAPNKVVNIQAPGWAAEPGIYFEFPSAAWGAISLAEGQYKTEGAGILLYVSAFLYDAETEVTIVCQEVTYTLTVKNVSPDEKPVVKKTCAEVYTLAKNDAVALNDVVVTYVNGKNVWVKDATASMLVFLPAANDAIKAGDVLSEVAGVVDIYNGVYEVKPSAEQVTAIVATPGEAPAAEVVTEVALTDVNKYIVMQNVEFAEEAAFAEGTQSNITINGVTVRNQFKNGYSFTTGKKYNVYGVVTIYSSKPQVYFITAEEASSTAIDNTVVSEKAIKMFENGQLIIIKNGVKYNALGSVIE